MVSFAHWLKTIRRLNEQNTIQNGKEVPGPQENHKTTK